MRTGDTIAAIASPPGRSARAILRISGAGVADLLVALLVDAPDRPGASRARLRLDGHILPVLVLRFVAPHSYTGEDACEVLLPGNPLLAERVLARVLDLPGIRPAEPGEFTARAFLSGKLPLDRAEGVAAVIAARTDEQLAAARDLLAGRTGELYRLWADELTTLLALVEAGIDFTDQEDVIAIPGGHLRTRLEDLARRIAARLGGAAGREAGDALPRVVLAGAPNAGKSTLFNALLGRTRAVVSPAPGTTRDVLAEELDLSCDLPGAGRILLLDAAGLGEAAPGGPDASAQARAREEIGRADVVVHCDPSGRFAPPPPDARGTTIRVRTKADLPAPPDDAAQVAVCALDGWNLGVLRRAIADGASGAGRAEGAAALLPRHHRVLSVALAAIREAAAGLSGAARVEQPEVAAVALREALSAIGDLTGHVSPDDVIGRIFATFCVGK